MTRNRIYWSGGIGIAAIGFTILGAVSGLPGASAPPAARSTQLVEVPSTNEPRPRPKPIPCVLSQDPGSYDAIRSDADVVAVVRYDGDRVVSVQPQPAAGYSGRRTLWEYPLVVERLVESRSESQGELTLLSIETEGQQPFLQRGRFITFLAHAADDPSGSRMLPVAGFHGLVQVSDRDTVGRSCPPADGTAVWRTASGGAAGKSTNELISIITERAQPASAR